MELLKFHFEPLKGWMNDPNGLIYHNGKYHIFYQYYPEVKIAGGMRWGHAVSDDLINFERLPIALEPDMPYESGGGCWSGSAIEKDGKLYLIYTSVSAEYGQRQSVAYNVDDDCTIFEKYADNPVIMDIPEVATGDFRDPKVSFIDGRYYMVLASGKDGIAKILYYRSDDLLKWDYLGVLYESDTKKEGPIFECPDFFKIGDKYVLMMSLVGRPTNTSLMILGDYDVKAEKFTPVSKNYVEHGPHYYAPQTFLAPDNRRIIFAWMHIWGREYTPDKDMRAGGLTAPREIISDGSRLYMVPAKEVKHLVTKLSDNKDIIQQEGNKLTVFPDSDKKADIIFDGEITDVEIIRDTSSIEIFINKGARTATFRF